MSVNGLVHVPGFGEFQMKQIDAPADPYRLNKSSNVTEKMEEDIKVIEVANHLKQVNKLVYY